MELKSKITGNWDKQSKQLQKKFSQLTDADLKFETGKESELPGRVETRLNKKMRRADQHYQKGPAKTV